MELVFYMISFKCCAVHHCLQSS
uniref:Uncharacterized protein n=1 Tax=Anguilla anguilla TaxID=7936 RepID=A0A0E9SK43_ANGAN